MLGHGHGRVEGRAASANNLDLQATAMWEYAGDCDRWGLGSEASAARRRTVEMRVGAMLARALMPVFDSPDDAGPAG